MTAEGNNQDPASGTTDEKDKTVDDIVPTQTEETGSVKKSRNRPRGPRNRKKNKNQEFPLLCEFMTIAYRLESVLHNGNKDGNTLFGKYTDKLQNNGVSVPGKSPNGGPSRKERKRLEHQKIKEHEDLISNVL